MDEREIELEIESLKERIDEDRLVQHEDEIEIIKDSQRWLLKQIKILASAIVEQQRNGEISPQTLEPIRKLSLESQDAQELNEAFGVTE